MINPLSLFSFGSKTYLILIAAVAISGCVWYITSKYNSMKVQVAELSVQLRDCRNANDSLRTHLTQKDKYIKQQKFRFDKAVERRQKLESDFKSLEKQKESDLEVFNKECGRIEKLMQKKAGLVVRAANRANQRLRKRFEDATGTGGSN